MPQYTHLLSPLPVNGVILKNRLISTKAIPTSLQGPEHYPAESTIAHMAGVARSGAAVVTCNAGDFSTKGMPPQAQDYAATAARVPGYESNIIKDFAPIEILRTSVQPYFSQMADAIHFYGSLASVSLMGIEPKGVNIADRKGPAVPPPMMDLGPMEDDEMPFFMEASKGITLDGIRAMQDSFVEKALLYQYLGFDMVTIYMCYGSSILARSLSPVKNTRTDQYGGSFENRARLSLELFRRIKEACGERFLIEVQISGEEEGGYTLDDLVRYGKMAEGLVDIFQLRGPSGETAEPSSFIYRKESPPTLRYAQALKEAGVRILTAPNGGFGDPALIDRFIAENQTDMVAMGRAFIAEPEYVPKLLSGRPLTPCIRCGRCHGSIDDCVAVCSVNPAVGLEHRLQYMVLPAETKKRVAVIGGGPAGMEAAIVCADRGHNVTLYEKEPALGGQLRHADYASFKWAVRDYKDYLINELGRRGVIMRLGHCVTPEELAAEGFDAVIAATGASPKTIPVPGGDDPNVFLAADIYGREHELGHRVLLVGGSETGTETGMYLAECGHDVTVLTRQKRLLHDAHQMHYPETIPIRYNRMENFHTLTQAETLSVTPVSVTYRKDGETHTLAADSVVICGGMESRQADALQYAGTAKEFYVIGDARKPANIYRSVRSAFGIASMI